MKILFLTFILIFTATEAFATSAVLPIKATIVNLTMMPIEEAIAFCDERNMACPAIRDKFEREYAQSSGSDFDMQENQAAILQESGIIRINDDYYVE